MSSKEVVEKEQEVLKALKNVSDILGNDLSSEQIALIMKVQALSLSRFFLIVVLLSCVMKVQTLKA